jgi:hypothetical protein
MLRKRKLWIALLAAVSLPAWSGCSGNSGPKLVKVRGKVVMQGRPLASGVVTFQPLENGQIATRRASIGVIGEDGMYHISTYADDDGAEPGEYLVAVDGSLKKGGGAALSIDPSDPAPAASGDNVPRKYLTPQSSGLKAKIPRDAGEVTLDFTIETG